MPTILRGTYRKIFCDEGELQLVYNLQLVISVFYGLKRHVVVIFVRTWRRKKNAVEGRQIKKKNDDFGNFSSENPAYQCNDMKYGNYVPENIFQASFVSRGVLKIKKFAIEDIKEPHVTLPICDWASGAGAD